MRRNQEHMSFEDRMALDDHNPARGMEVKAAPTQKVTGAGRIREDDAEWEEKCRLAKLATDNPPAKAAKKKKTDQFNSLRNWLVQGIVNGIAPLIANGVLTEEQGDEAVTDILVSLDANKPKP